MGALNAATMTGNDMTKTQRKTFREMAEIFLSCPADEDTRELISSQMPDLPTEDITAGMAMVWGLYRRAIGGDHKAFVALRDTVGEIPSQQINLHTDDALDVRVQFVQATLPGIDLGKDGE